MKRRTFLGAALAAVSLAMSSAALGFRAAAAQVASALKPRPRRMRLPPVPKWNQATDDIDGGDFLRRCGDYERSFLPPSLHFPRTGQIWEAVRDCEVHVSPIWPARGKGMVAPNVPVIWPKTRLRQGEKVRILELDDPRPLTVLFVPVRYAELRESIAPQSLDYRLSVRTARTFTSLCLPDKSAYFSDLFRLVEDTA